MLVKFSKDGFEGCKAGDRVRFENKAEGLAAVAGEFGIEVRWDDEKQEYVEVVRVTEEVKDSAGATST